VNGYGKVHVDVTEARAGVREAILVDVLPEVLNPGAAHALAADIRAAIVIVDRLAPPKAIAPRETCGDPACGWCAAR
jgi:hypothetical protein